MLVILPFCLIPLLIARVVRRRPQPLFAVFVFGFMGMAFEISFLYLFQIAIGQLYIHIGPLLAVFMAGLASGAWVPFDKRRNLSLMTFALSCALSLCLLPIIDSGMCLPGVVAILYILSALIGFSTGAGFAFLVDSARLEGCGAVLYASDLFGALTAAVFIPGLMIWIGTFPLFIALTVMSAINGANVWLLK